MILVTGGSGFIGSHTVRALHALGEPSVVLQREVRVLEEITEHVVTRADLARCFRTRPRHPSIIPVD